MIISLSGAGGSGKSTIAMKLADKLGWPRYYIGGLRREMAARRGLTLAEYNKLGESDPATDMEVDDYQKKLGETEDNFIIEGRLAWHFIPHSLKIYLDVSEDEAARRIFSELEARNESQEDKKLETYEDVLRSIKSRKERDVYRYQKYYNLNPFNPKNYDLTVDTTNLNIDEVLTEVYEFVKNRLS